MVLQRELSRRDFLKLSAGSAAGLGLLLSGFPRFEELLAAAVDEVPVIWLQAGTCTGCSVAVLNSLSPRIQNILVDEVVPGKHVSLRYHATIMAGAGDVAMKALEETAAKKGGYILIVEGAIPTKDNGVYCQIGEKDGNGITALQHATNLGQNALAVIALGTCAVGGGIPAAAPNPTGSVSVGTVFADAGIKTPVINLPGCPPHPDWFVGTVASVLIGGLSSVQVDEQGRPVAFYGKLIHDNCPRRGYFDLGKFAKTLSEPYCLYELGCKGPVTHADCPIRLWNSGTNWCVGANAPCIGCCEPTFPDAVSPFRQPVTIYGVTPPSWLPPVEEEKGGFSAGAAAGLGAIGGVVAGAAAGAVAASRLAKRQADKED
jgi:hydrogenase small subunit